MELACLAISRPPAKNRQGRNTAYVVAGRQAGYGFGIDLRKPRLALQVTAHLLKSGCHHAAGAAPGRPKVHHDGSFALGELGLERSLVEVVRLRGQQGMMALTAMEFGLQFIERHAVGRVAMGADQMNRFHDFSQQSPSEPRHRCRRSCGGLFLSAVHQRRRVTAHSKGF